MTDNHNEDEALIVLISGTRDDEGNLSFNDENPDGEPFWVAVKIAADKVDDFNEALERYENLGTNIDMTLYAEKIVKQGSIAEAQPSGSELQELRAVYGDNLKEVSNQNGWASDENSYQGPDMP